MNSLVLNDRDLKNARRLLERLDTQLSGRAALEASKEGIAEGVWAAHRSALERRKKVILRAVELYERAKSADSADLFSAIDGDPGLALVVARISRGLSQKEFARRVGLKEQQIQRYEADKYRSISLANYGRLARALGVSIKPYMLRRSNEWIGEDIISEYSSETIRKILWHGRASGWFRDGGVDADSKQSLALYLSDAHRNYGSPALLRSSGSRDDSENEFALLSWRARVTDVFFRNRQRIEGEFDPLDLSWIPELVRKSRSPVGPLDAVSILADHGIGFVYEPQLPGLRLDGAAFLVEGTPLIAMTLRFDRIDYFWFTLLHELAHVFLHIDLGMAAGFFNDFEEGSVDEFEKEADMFASEFVVKSDVWRRSPARISKAEQPFLDLSEKLGIHSALLFGRARKERSNYTLFSSKVGQGEVRRLFEISQTGA